MEFHLVEMVLFSGDIYSLAGDGTEPVVMAVAALIKDFGAAG